MNGFVDRSISSLKRWKPGDWLWRLSILSLPWQTRIFVEGPSLAGYPWEQGRMSIYASMCFMGGYLLTSIVEKRSRRPLTLKPLMILGFLLLGIVTLVTMNRRATAMWIVQVMMLIFFFVNLARDRMIEREKLATWFCVSMIPHAVLGIVQFLDQKVIASTWLGIAGQIPETLGVSVIEREGERVLRAYGGFPHPNIFGGWLVFATAGSLFLAFRHHGKGLLTWFGTTLLFATALFLTFSRSAWLAAAMLTASVAAVWYVKTADKAERRRILTTVGLLAGFLLLLGLWRSDLLLTRTQVTERLEAKSFEERGFAIELAEHLIGEHWLVGTGQGAYLFTLVQEKIWDKAAYPGPPIPPHNTFVLMFAELGLLGALGAVLLGGSILKQITLRREWLHYRSLVFFAPLILLGIFDHYLWSYWPGQALFVLVVTGWALTLDIYE